MTVFVTGATGTVGRHVVNQLIQRGVKVRALSRNPEKAKLPAGVEVVKGDLTVPESLQDAMRDVESLFLITASDKADVWLQTDPGVIEAARKAGVKRVVVLVSYEEGPVEEALKASGMAWTLVKPVEFMDNILVDWQESIRRERVVREPFGDAPSARVHEGDIAAVAVEALLNDGHHGQSYIVTGPEVLTRREAVRTISEVIGEEIRFIELTEEEARQNWQSQGYDEASIDFFVEMGKNPPKVGHTVLPTVEQVTGRPARTLAEWAAEHRDAFL